jgi:glutamate N-acetyltransferase/amino-acid N-acetyltransferase
VVERWSDIQFRAFRKALDDLLSELSLMLLADGRKDGKIMHVEVVGAASPAAARRIGRAVTNSLMARQIVRQGSLRLNGQTATGRLIAAVGSSTEKVDPDRLEIRVGEGTVVSAGGVATDLPEDVESHLSGTDVTIRIDAATGRGRGTVWSVVEVA